MSKVTIALSGANYTEETLHRNYNKSLTAVRAKLKHMEKAVTAHAKKSNNSSDQSGLGDVL